MVLSGFTPKSFQFSTRYVAQCDQYTRWVSRCGPPINRQTGTPSALAARSQSASSRPAIAICVAPYAAWRVYRYRSM